MDFQNLIATPNVGIVQHDLTVEAARAQQRGIEHIWSVGGRDDDDIGVGVEAVHLHQNLVQRLLAFVVATAEAGAALAAHGIDLVDEDDAGRVALGLIEQIAYPAGADADEHLDEFGATDGEERHAGFAGNGAREQRFAGAGRADQQDAARNARAERGKFIGILEKLHHLGEFLLRLLHPGDIGERDRGPVARQTCGPGSCRRKVPDCCCPAPGAS